MQQHWPGLQDFRRPSLKSDSLIWYRTVCTEHDNFLHCKPRHICYTLPHFGEDEWKKDEEVFKDTNVKRKYQLQLSFMSCTECWWCNRISGIIFYFVQHFATHFSRWQCFIQLNSLKVVYWDSTRDSTLDSGSRLTSTSIQHAYQTQFYKVSPGMGFEPMSFGTKL